MRAVAFSIAATFVASGCSAGPPRNAPLEVGKAPAPAPTPTPTVVPQAAQAPPAPTADSPPAERCAPIARENERRLARLHELNPKVFTEEELTWIQPVVEPCLADDHQVWGLSFVGRSPTPEHRWELLLEIANVRAGEVVTACTQYVPPGPVPCTGHGDLDWPYGLEKDDVELGGVFDYDGDGFAELFVNKRERRFLRNYTWVEVWTVHNRTLQLYPPTHGRALAAVRDVDHDGRPDLLTRAHVQVCIDEEERGAPEGSGPICDAKDAPLYWERSLPDGTFARPVPMSQPQLDELAEDPGEALGHP